MTPANTAQLVTQHAGLTPENAELLARYAGHLERSPLTGRSPPLSSCARRAGELTFCQCLA
jgi:hypothetical protein